MRISGRGMRPVQSHETRNAKRPGLERARFKPCKWFQFQSCWVLTLREVFRTRKPSLSGFYETAKAGLR